ncbi:hypothetical protein [Burkholderia ubonensis]|uniref:hypothetical protein n=1 Tax=Burkholderia ubonensis TaxID=101571 RepID=UPI0012FA3982|nr:hypothetical protein [Burkholderia ubonensis]
MSTAVEYGETVAFARVQTEMPSIAFPAMHQSAQCTVWRPNVGIVVACWIRDGLFSSRPSGHADRFIRRIASECRSAGGGPGASRLARLVRIADVKPTKRAPDIVSDRKENHRICLIRSVHRSPNLKTFATSFRHPNPFVL